MFVSAAYSSLAVLVLGKKKTRLTPGLTQLKPERALPRAQLHHRRRRLPGQWWSAGLWDAAACDRE